MAELEFLGRLSVAFGDKMTKALPANINTVASLKLWLDTEHGGAHLSAPTVRAIVNHKIASDSQAITDNDIIAFYPPVGGG